MNSPSFSPEEALARMSSVVAGVSASNRAELADLFVAAFSVARGRAVTLYMRAIEALLRQKIAPDREITRLVAAVCGSENPLSLIDVLSSPLPQAYAKIAYPLHVYTMRALVFDEDAEVDIDRIRAVAGEKDLGRLAAIDLIITRRKKPDAAILALLRSLVQSLESRDVLMKNAKRAGAVRRILSLDVNSQELPPPINFEHITTSKQVNGNISILAQQSPSAIRRWLADLASDETANGGRTAHQRSSLSHALTNLGKHFTEDAVVVEIWSLAINLESTLDAPTHHIYDKLRRLLLVTSMHPQADYSALRKGFSLCIDHSKLDPNTMTKADIEPFVGIGAALHELNGASWSIVLSEVLQIASSHTRQSAAQLLILLASTGNLSGGKIEHWLCDNSRSAFGELMSLALQPATPALGLQLQQAYFALFDEVYDREAIRATLGLDIPGTCKAIAMGVLARSSRDELECHMWCERFVEQAEASEVDEHIAGDVARVIDEHAFIDLKPRIQPVVGSQLDDQILPQLANLKLSLAKSAHSKDMLQHIELNVAGWRILRAKGCHNDALRCLRTALAYTETLHGRDSVRYLSYAKVLRDFLREIRAEDFVTALGLHENDDLSKRQPSVLHEIADAFTNELTNSIMQPHGAIEDFGSAHEKVQTLIERDTVLALAADAALMCPPALKLAKAEAAGPGSHTSGLHTHLGKLNAAMQQANTETDWLKFKELAEAAEYLDLVAQNTGEHAHSASSDGTQPHSLSTVLLGSRSFHTSQVFPQYAERLADTGNLNMICVSLRVDKSGALIIERLDRSGPVVTVRLPQARALSLTNSVQPLQYVDALEEIDRILKQSSLESSAERKEFWESQKALDDSLKALIVRMQRSWLGGFSDLLFASDEELRPTDSSLVSAYSHIIANYVTPRRKVNSLNPVITALLQRAVLRDNFDDLEDLLFSVFDAANFQGAGLSCDEVDLDSLIAELRSVTPDIEAQTPQDPSNAAQVRSEPHIVLVCDRRATRIPWESFPALQNRSVTRALSVGQLNEWIRRRSALEQPHEEPPTPAMATKYHRPQSCGNSKVTYVINPEGDLMQTQNAFESEFKLRGWYGIAGTKPSESNFVEQWRNSATFIYVGHGSGRSYARSAKTREAYATANSVFLLGCQSVRLHHELLDDDVLTDYIVAGASLVMGNLWNVKDKEYNRFSKEFLSRVFDDGEDVGHALKESRDACYLRYITAGAPVIYGLP